MHPSPPLIFIKLGGSLITDKDNAHTAKPEIIYALACQIQNFLHLHPLAKILVGHGSGSFGHIPASRYQTRKGVKSQEEWQGFLHVWKEARALNEIVLEQFQRCGLPVLSFPAASAVTTENGVVKQWNIAPMQQALDHGIIPLVFGDVIFDTVRGGTILSTEEIFHYLCPILQPDSILITGIEPGVWEDYPDNTKIIPRITPATLHQYEDRLKGSKSTDVTGGMYEKVRTLLKLCGSSPTLSIQIFSGFEQTLNQVLEGCHAGTLLESDKKEENGGNQQ